MLLLLLAGGGCSIPNAYQPPGPYDKLLHVQACLPGRQAVLTETLVDATDAPGKISGQDWADMLLHAQSTGRIMQTTGGPRTLVTVREVDLGEGPDSAPSALGMGHTSISQGVASDGGGGQALRDITSAGQPVYELATNRAQGEVLGVHVHSRKVIDGKEQSIQYWYLPPGRIPSSGFTEWLRPSLQKLTFAPPYVEGLLWSGKPIPVSEVDADAPRIRYTQVGNAEYWNRGNDFARARRMQALAHAAGVNVVVAGPRRRTGIIAGC